MPGDRGLYALSPFLIGEWAFCLEETDGHLLIVIPRLRSEGRNGGRHISHFFSTYSGSQPPPLRGTSFQGKEGECRRNRTAIPRTSPSGRPLEEKGGRMPFSASSFRAKARNLFRSRSGEKREGSGEREALPSMRLGRTVFHADSITKGNGNGKRKRSLGCARDDETGKRLFPFLFIPL